MNIFLTSTVNKRASVQIQKLSMLCFLLISFSCGEKKEVTHIIDSNQIVGEPILVPEDEPKAEDEIKPQPKDVLSANLDHSAIEKNVTKTLEGIVVQGKIRTDDQNATDIKNIERLPPLPKGSHYKSVDFRDLTDFEYEVEWERDGIEFDYPAFAERVPENLRKISSTKVAIEGFMIPTVVDENNEVKEFLLLPDQMSCCFGQTPEANGWVVVNADDGVEVMMDRIIRVTGELVVEERWDEEFFVGLYHMTCREITGPSL